MEINDNKIEKYYKPVVRGFRKQSKTNNKTAILHLLVVLVIRKQKGLCCFALQYDLSQAPLQGSMQVPDSTSHALSLPHSPS